MSGNSLAVLLVEDDARDAKLTVLALQNGNAGIRIEVVEDGEQALDFLLCRGAYSERSFERTPQVILLDLKLPKVDGLQVLREIKRRDETRPIPVVALTSSREEKDMVECYRLGVNSYVQKPVDFEEFRETIKSLGIYWTTINERPPAKAFSCPTAAG
jgi:two-component system response regulator